MIPNQISIRFIHELCFGVYTNRIRWRGSCRNSARLSIFFKIPHFPFFPGSLSIPQASETNRTGASDLWVLSPSQTNVQDASGSVRTSASTAFTKSSSVRVGFGYGTSIRPDATSKNPIRPVVPSAILCFLISAVKRERLHWLTNGFARLQHGYNAKQPVRQSSD